MSGYRAITERASELYGNRCLRQGWTAALVSICMLAAIVCAACSGITSHAGASSDPVTLVTGHEDVILLPQLGAGKGGWCVTTIATTGCSTLRRPVLLGPVLVEIWSGQSSTSEAPARKGLVLATSEVASISLDGSAPIAVRPGSALPDDLRGAVVELRGGSGRHVLGIAAPPPLPRSHFIGLTASGQPIPQSRVPGPPLEFEVPSRSWEGSASPPHGVCSISSTRLAGLVSTGGGVMTTVRSHPDVRGREFVDCARVSYLLAGWPLKANLLLDAAHPGATPSQLPEIRALAGHPGVFVAPGVEGEMLVRLIPGAWLSVGEGEDVSQRLLLLEHLRAAIRQ